jgi:membrane-bound metal-dependent hydrolase YbcI (DUF457 family)
MTISASLLSGNLCVTFPPTYAPSAFRGNLSRSKRSKKLSFPIAHSLVGYACYRVGKNKNRSWKEAAFFAFAATAADFDYIPGVLVGKPFLFHHSITHSIGFALIFGLGAALLGSLFGKRSFLKVFLLSSAVYATHPLLDLLTADHIPLLWPFQSADLTQQFLLFRSLPLCQDGLKDFACGVFSNFSHVQRLWREIFFLSTTLAFFFFRAALRFVFAPAKRHAIITGIPPAYAD